MAIARIRGRDWRRYTSGNKNVTTPIDFHAFVVQEKRQSRGVSRQRAGLSFARCAGTILAQHFAAIGTAQTPIRPL
jgi:hypothetical protein